MKSKRLTVNDYLLQTAIVYVFFVIYLCSKGN